jgi:CHRD domain/FG-GAP-like repeat
MTTTTLVGSQEVPPTGSSATGTGTVMLSADHTMITVDLSWSGLSSNASAAHIHGPAAAGVSGPIIFPFTGVSAATSGAIATQTFAVTPTQVAQLRAGLFYFNVHSQTFGGGEIRGQILPVCEAARADFDGDGKSDLSVFRPSEGNWYQNRSAAGMTATNFGLGSDTLVPGDYDGDGKTDVAVFRGDSTDSHPDFFILNSSNNTISYAYWGLDTDIPITGDRDGDGKSDITVYRPSTGSWYIMRSTQGVEAESFGSPGDVPMFMDYDNDGKANLTVFRPSTGTWYIAKPTGLPSENFDAVQFGQAGDNPVPADYDGDHRDDIAIFRPSTGDWYAIFSGDNSFHGIHFGQTGDVPVPADYDGDSRADIAVYREGIWYMELSGSDFAAANYGLPTDIPIPKKYIP